MHVSNMDNFPANSTRVWVEIETLIFTCRNFSTCYLTRIRKVPIEFKCEVAASSSNDYFGVNQELIE